MKNIIILIIGAVVGIVIYQQLPLNNMTESAMTADSADGPLYWVAPMDPNYRREQPGLSPMGMELIPVYANDDNSEAGTVTISPDVVNNLGVRTAPVEMAVLNKQIKTVGYVQYDEDKLQHIHPRVEGWIEKLYVKASGDPVKRGQPLYTLYSPELVNAQEEYLIAIKRNNARLIKAAEDRLKALQLPSSVIANLKKSQQVKQSITFYAPQSGVISMLNIREGFYVKPSTSMMSIGVLDNVWVQVEVFERQANQVKVGQPVVMTLSYIPGREWLGKVDYIYPTLEPSTRTLKVRLKFDNDDFSLMPNMFAQVEIDTGNTTPSLVVAKEAVIRTGEMNRVVLALGEGQFKSIEVQTGRSDDNYIEILNGLKQGESVVTSAQFLIDSESSKDSDFKRMSHGMGMAMTSSMTKSVMVEATLNQVLADTRQINVTHQSIPEWNRPQMTMTLKVAEQVDLAMFNNDQIVTLSISDIDGKLVVQEIAAGMAMPMNHGDMMSNQMNTEQETR